MGGLPAIFRNLKSYHRHGELNCPSCEVTMTPYRCENAVIDLCYACNGIWFDDREIGVFKRSLETFDLSQLKILFHPPRPEAIEITACPRCREVLNEETYAYNTDVRAHRCLKCNGIWLPPHEMVGFVHLAKTGQAIAPHLSAFLKEHALMMQEIAFFQSLKRAARFLTQPVHDFLRLR